MVSANSAVSYSVYRVNVKSANAGAHEPLKAAKKRPTPVAYAKHLLSIFRYLHV